jgi:hypothetical protein
MTLTVQVYKENTRIDVFLNKNIILNDGFLQIFEEYYEKNQLL